MPKKITDTQRKYRLKGNVFISKQIFSEDSEVRNYSPEQMQEFVKKITNVLDTEYKWKVSDYAEALKYGNLIVSKKTIENFNLMVEVISKFVKL